MADKHERLKHLERLGDEVIRPRVCLRIRKQSFELVSCSSQVAEKHKREAMERYQSMSEEEKQEERAARSATH